MQAGAGAGLGASVLPMKVLAWSCGPLMGISGRDLSPVASQCSGHGKDQASHGHSAHVPGLVASQKPPSWGADPAAARAGEDGDSPAWAHEGSGSGDGWHLHVLGPTVLEVLAARSSRWEEGMCVQWDGVVMREVSSGSAVKLLLKCSCGAVRENLGAGSCCSCWRSSVSPCRGQDMGVSLLCSHYPCFWTGD